MRIWTILRILIALVLFVGGVIGAVSLRLSDVVGEWPFVALIGGSILIAVVVLFYDRILSFSVSSFKVEFDKVEASRKEVEQREQEVKRIATTLAEIVAFIAAFGRRYGGDAELEAKWFRQKLNGMLDAVGISEGERQRLFQYLDATDKMDAIKDTDKAAGMAQWNNLWQKIKDEVQRGK